MVGLVFTFEGTAVQTSAALGRALHVARGDQRIVVEQTRGDGGGRTQVAVLFSDLGQLDGFTARLARALPQGISIAALRAIRDDYAVNSSTPVARSAV